MSGQLVDRDVGDVIVPFFFFFNDTATTEIYTLSLHDRSSDLHSGEPAGGPESRRPRGHRNPGDAPPAEGDRKSTRLNSSHSQISYAVFCLKKKKKQTPSSNESSESRATSTSTRVLPLPPAPAS